MLREIKSDSREAGQKLRRWFSDEELDLIVWYDEHGTVQGFQLCYEKSRAEHALTWQRNRGYSHSRIDDGEQSPLKNNTPVLVADGLVPYQKILASFGERCAELEHGIAEFVLEKLSQAKQPDRADT